MSRSVFPKWILIDLRSCCVTRQTGSRHFGKEVEGTPREWIKYRHWGPTSGSPLPESEHHRRTRQPYRCICEWYIFYMTEWRNGENRRHRDHHHRKHYTFCKYADRRTKSICEVRGEVDFALSPGVSGKSYEFHTPCTLPSSNGQSGVSPGHCQSPIGWSPSAWGSLDTWLARPLRKITTVSSSLL